MERIVIFTSNNRSGRAVYNALKTNKPEVKLLVIRENQSNKKNLLKRRIKKHGWLKVADQLFFQVVIARLLRMVSKNRQRELLEDDLLKFDQINLSDIRDVETINDPEVLELLYDFDPDLVVVSGTRIIKNNILKGLNCRIVNLHVGITPEYRGVHGAYWALVNNDAEHAGVTLHYVDQGIDTGSVLAQKKCVFKSSDNFTTYPLVQLRDGIELLLKYLKTEKQGQLITEGIKGKLYYHPRASEYVFNLINKSVK